PPSLHKPRAGDAVPEYFGRRAIALKPLQRLVPYHSPSLRSSDVVFMSRESAPHSRHRVRGRWRLDHWILLNAPPSSASSFIRQAYAQSLSDMLRKGSAMKIECHDTGPRMSKAVIHGDTVYLAGIVADSPKGKSMAEQTRSILSQIDRF